MSKKQKNSKPSVFGILLGGITLAAVVYFIFDYNYFIDLMIAHQYKPSEEMRSLIEDIELTKDGMRIINASMPTLQSASNFNGYCANNEKDATALGCYANGKIYVYDIENEELEGIKQAVLTHELLHAVWKRTSTLQRNRLMVYLDSVYAENREALEQHMAFYPDESRTDELHSIIGTQIPLDQMPTELAEHYQKYLGNQAKIVSYYNAYSGRFAELQNKLDELSEKIQKLSNEIDEDTESYNQKYDQLKSDIEDFNRRASSINGNATMEEYRELNDRKLALREEYDELAAKIDEVNELIDEYNQDFEHAGWLYESINSKKESTIESPDTVK